MRREFWLDFVLDVIRNRRLGPRLYLLFLVDNLYERMQVMAGSSLGQTRYSSHAHMWKLKGIDWATHGIMT